MELKTFVAESLTQICEGISEAQQKVDKLGACISPRVRAVNTNHVTVDECEPATAPSKITFDVALEVVQGDSTGKTVEGSALLRVASFGIGTSGKRETEKENRTSTISRIVFDLNVVWPSSTYVDKGYKGLNQGKAPEGAFNLLDE